MKVKAWLHDPKTGARCVDESEWPELSGEDLVEAGQAVLWQWTEGNYGCDCNRHLFLARAGQPGYDEEEDRPCSPGEPTIQLERLSCERDGHTTWLVGEAP